MKRYSTLLLIACWLVCLFVLSTVTLHLDSIETKKVAKQQKQTEQAIAAHTVR